MNAHVILPGVSVSIAFQAKVLKTQTRPRWVPLTSSLTLKRVVWLQVFTNPSRAQKMQRHKPSVASVAGDVSVGLRCKSNVNQQVFVWFED